MPTTSSLNMIMWVNEEEVLRWLIQWIINLTQYRIKIHLLPGHLNWLKNVIKIIMEQLLLIIQDIQEVHLLVCWCLFYLLFGDYIDSVVLKTHKKTEMTMILLSPFFISWVVNLNQTMIDHKLNNWNEWIQSSCFFLSFLLAYSRLKPL